MLVLPIEISQTAATAVWSFNSQVIAGGAIKHVVCKAATANTTFNFTITDDKDNIIYAPSESTGTQRAEVDIPVRGIITIAVDTSSVDEAFTGRVTIDERRS